MEKRLLIVVVALLLGNLSPTAHAYKEPTHRDIAERAAASDVSTVDEVLRRDLDMPAGVRATFPGRSVPGPASVARLIGDGALFEDIPGSRSLRHFHNPLQPWDNAGLSRFLQSSVVWQQTPAQIVGRKWAWRDARTRYVRALTDAGIEERSETFGEMFETLGHLVHLIQDAAVPAHVRNDRHLLREGYESHLQTLQGSAVGSERRTRFDAFLTETPIKPPASIFTATNHDRAPVPIARLIDTNLFHGANWEELGRPDIGIAEYTNGNFLSDDTIFKKFDLPRRSALGPDFTEEVRGRHRRYFEKDKEGQGVRHFVAEGTLYRSASERLGRPMDEALVLTREVYEDYAAHLLPRAVGYSAALLDYFFRGRLSGDIIPDAENPDLVRFEGVNASTERLDGGTLQLYGDNAEGVRTKLAMAAPGVDVTVSAEPGQPVNSEIFNASADAERFVAVYTGTLGGERPGADPARDPGAVIGKVLGGVRVEQVHSDGGRWHLRTPHGVFPLPITVAEIEELRWGDVDNTLVGRTALGSAAPNRFKTYRLNRAVGDARIPLDESGVVQLTATADLPFPLGLPTGTSVTFTHVQHFVDVQAVYQASHDFHFDPADGTYFVFETETRFNRVFVGEPIVTSLEVRSHSTSGTISEAFAATLDPMRYRAPGDIRPYVWDVMDFGLDARGRVLATVRIELTRPRTDRVNVTIAGIRDEETGAVPPMTVGFQTGYPAEAGRVLLFVIVDVSAGTIVASTATPVVRLSTSGTSFSRQIHAHIRGTARGGPRSGQQIERWVPQSSVPLESPELQERLGGQPVEVLSGGAIALDGPAPVVDFTGRFRPELETAVRQYFRLDVGTRTSTEVYAVRVPPPPCEGCTQPPLEIMTYELNELTVHQHGYLPVVAEARRSRPTDSAQHLLVFDSPVGIAAEPEVEGLLVSWRPQEHQATRAIPGELPAAAAHRVAGTTGRRALVVSRRFGVPTTRLVNLDDGSMLEFDGEDLTDRFTVLDPAFLYNVQDTRFYRQTNPLQQTALPARLKAGNPVGDYHVLRLP